MKKILILYFQKILNNGKLYLAIGKLIAISIDLNYWIWKFHNKNWMIAKEFNLKN